MFDIRRCFDNVETEQAFPSGEKKSQDRGPKSKSTIKTLIVLSFIALKKVVSFSQLKNCSCSFTLLFSGTFLLLPCLFVHNFPGKKKQILTEMFTTFINLFYYSFKIFPGL